MTTSISSEELQNLIAGYVLYTLSPEEAIVFEQLADDPAIANEIEKMQEALELAYAPSEIQPPSELRAAVLHAARESVSRTSAPSTNSSLVINERPILSPTIQGNRPRRWLMGLGAIAAALIAALGISNVVLWRSLRLARAQLEMQTPVAEGMTVSLSPTEDGNAAEVTILIDSDGLRATLNVEDLPPLSEGQVYVLWTVLQDDAPFTTDDKNAILTETFTVSNQGTQSEQIPLPPVYRDSQWVKAIAITVESADAPQAHESSPILIQTL
jgi:hypothetical protein